MTVVKCIGVCVWVSKLLETCDDVCGRREEEEEEQKTCLSSTD